MGHFFTKVATNLFLSKDGRKVVGWLLVAILSPPILLMAFLCCLGSGVAQHNNSMVDYCFYNIDYAGEIPAEYAGQITAIRTAFSSLDSAVVSINSIAEDGGLDSIQVKAAFYILCPDGGTDADAFIKCFYTTEERTRTVTVMITNEEGEPEEIEQEESYTVAIPYSLNTAYANLAIALGRDITEEEKEYVHAVYTRIAGSGGEGYDGAYLRGNAPRTELDISTFTVPSTKNAHDLVAYAVYAWESGWGYVWGTYVNVLSESLLEYKLEQYPDGVGQFETFIRSHWLDGRTADCVGLIKGYGWLDPDTLDIKYGTNGMPDIGANTMYHNATVSGPIDTIPDIPGLAVWMDGHIGVYIGNGEVIEAMGTKKGVVKTVLEGRGWTHWLEIPYIDYN